MRRGLGRLLIERMHALASTIYVTAPSLAPRVGASCPSTRAATSTVNLRPHHPTRRILRTHSTDADATTETESATVKGSTNSLAGMADGAWGEESDGEETGGTEKGGGSPAEKYAGFMTCEPGQVYRQTVPSHRPVTPSRHTGPRRRRQFVLPHVNQPAK